MESWKRKVGKFLRKIPVVEFIVTDGVGAIAIVVVTWLVAFVINHLGPEHFKAVYVENSEQALGWFALVILILGLLRYLARYDAAEAVHEILRRNEPRAIDVKRIATGELRKALEATSPDEIALSPPWLPDDARRKDWILQHIETTDVLRVAAYSFETMKDRMEVPIKALLARGGKVRLLLLHPNSTGLQVTTALEAFGSLARTGRPFSAKQWKKHMKNVRRQHQTTIASTSQAIRNWADVAAGGSIEVRYYTEAPILLGWCFDDSAFSAYFYFQEPTSRGFTLPLACISNVDQADVWARVLHQAFSSWFDVQFALGLKK